MLNLLTSFTRRVRTAAQAGAGMANALGHVAEMAGVVASVTSIQLGVAGQSDSHLWTPTTRKTVIGFVSSVSKQFADELQLDEATLFLMSMDMTISGDGATIALLRELDAYRDADDAIFRIGFDAGVEDYARFIRNEPTVGLLDRLGVA